MWSFGSTFISKILPSNSVMVNVFEKGIFDVTTYLETGCWFPLGLPLVSGEAVLHSTISPAGKQSGL